MTDPRHGRPDQGSGHEARGADGTNDSDRTDHSAPGGRPRPTSDADRAGGSGFPDEAPLTAAERAALAALPRERIPPAHLEDRVVAALEAEGLLGPRRPSGDPPSGSGVVRLRPSAGWLAAAVAAGLALFAAGTVTGQRMAARDAMEAVSAALGEAGAADPAARAARVQETGSAYVRAVAGLVDGPSAGGGASTSGLEAARVALHAAALELARANPDDPTIRLVLAVLEERAGAGAGSGGSDGAVRTTIWF